MLVGEGYPTAAAFAEAVAAAVAPADPAAVVARVEASQPEGRPAWLGRRRVLEQALRAEAASGAAAPALATPEAARRPATAAPPAPFELAPPAGWSPPPEDSPSLPVAAPPARAHAAAAPGQRSHASARRPRPPTPAWRARLPPPEARRSPTSSSSWPARSREPSPAAPDPSAAWLDHPRAPLVVVVGLGLLGLLLGLALGGR